MESIGSKIRKIRIQHGLAQKELAKMTGLPASQISRWEKGTIVPKLESIRKICEVLAIDEREIIVSIQDEVQKEYFDALKKLENFDPRIVKMLCDELSLLSETELFAEILRIRNEKASRKQE